MAGLERTEIPRLALGVTEAAGALGISWDCFHEHVAPHLRWVQVGRRKVVSVAELQRFLDERARETIAEAWRP